MVLPWVTIPIFAIASLILLLNIAAPSSNDVRVINYGVQVIPRVTGLVTEVPIEANRPLKKGDVLFKIDDEPFALAVKGLEAKVAELQARLLTSQAYDRELRDQLKVAAARRQSAASKISGHEAQIIGATAHERELKDQLSQSQGAREALSVKLELARKRFTQNTEMARAGAGPRFDLEQAEADVRNLEAELRAAQAAESQISQRLSARTTSNELAEVASARSFLQQGKDDLTAAEAAESQIVQKLSARTKSGDLAEVAQAKSMLLQTEAELAEAKWKLAETVYYAPADGTVINLQLRPGAMASQMPFKPVMTFIENEQWLIALYHQNEVRQVKPGQEAEIALETYPGRIIKCKVDTVVWATAQGQLPISGVLPETEANAIPPGRLAVRLNLDPREKGLFLAAGARGHGAIYTDHHEAIQILRKVMIRVASKLDWFVLKLH